MNRFFKLLSILKLLALVAAIELAGCSTPSTQNTQQYQIHTWQMQEIVLLAEKPYPNYYTDVDIWVQLKGPGFDKRVYGFWDGENRFVVRVVATVRQVQLAEDGAIAAVHTQ
ncbi:MAG: DUF5060 domain-containing protein, partial [Burkholderiaceae bacterium]|nr:DUF5060 domain-containing protein [Burkholderiaceae bacterium]